MKSPTYTLRQKLLGPLFALLIGIVFIFGYFIFNFYFEYSNLRGKLTLTSNVAQHTMEVSRLRSQAQDVLLLYRQSHNPRHLTDHHQMISARNSHLEALRSLAQSSPTWSRLGKALIGGLDESAALQKTIISATQKGDVKSADVAFAMISTIFDINSSRLKDFSIHLQGDLREHELSFEILLTQTLWTFGFLFTAVLVAIWFISVMYRRGVLNPLLRLQSGLQALALGNMSVHIPLETAPREIGEMMTDFNKMVSVLKNTQDDLTQARESALKSAQTKSEFLSNMSHELRTPLNTIIGMADELYDEELPSEKRRYVQILKNSGKMLNNIINDILDYSKLEAGRVILENTNFDVKELITKTAEVIEVTAKRKNLNFDVFVTPNKPCWVSGDPNRLEQILLNLLGNAVKFTERGGITLDGTIEVESGWAKIKIKILDTGVGMNKDDLDRVFLRFTQSDTSVTRKFGGTGLGLAIVKQLLDIMGGQITVNSQRDSGSEFILDLNFPLGEAKAQRTVAEPAERASFEALKDKRILLVDDSEDNRFLIEAYLKNVGTRITVAENGKFAVEAYRKGTFDLILMDMQMPVMDGYTATEKIRQIENERKTPPVPVIALTAFALNVEVGRSLRAGCNRHLTKPVSKQDLLVAMTDLLVGGGYSKRSIVSNAVQTRRK